MAVLAGRTTGAQESAASQVPQQLPLSYQPAPSLLEPAPAPGSGSMPLGSAAAGAFSLPRGVDPTGASQVVRRLLFHDQNRSSG
jgi:hypothetical protein